MIWRSDKGTWEYASGERERIEQADDDSAAEAEREHPHSLGGLAQPKQRSWDPHKTNLLTMLRLNPWRPLK
jgi:hypothetical protein